MSTAMIFGFAQQMAANPYTYHTTQLLLEYEARGRLTKPTVDAAVNALTTNQEIKGLFQLMRMLGLSLVIDKAERLAKAHEIPHRTADSLSEEAIGPALDAILCIGTHEYLRQQTPTVSAAWHSAIPATNTNLAPLYRKTSPSNPTPSQPLARWR